MNTQTADEPKLSADFADRVLQAADRRLSQHRRLGWAAGASVLCGAVAAALNWNGMTTAPEPSPASPKQIFAAAAAPSVQSREDSTDPLSYLFPDAGPVERFATEDGDTAGAEDAGALFDERD
jgi:hypothetical protein